MDNAVGEFGRAVEAELGRIDAKTQKKADALAENTLRKWLGLPQRYRDPVKSGHVALPGKAD